MNILVDSFVNSESTESLYWYEEINKIESINTFYWPNVDISAYDVFYDTKPDLFLTHIDRIGFAVDSNHSYEVIHYIKNNDIKVFARTEPNERCIHQVKNLCEFLDKKDRSKITLISTDRQIDRWKVINLLPAADSNLLHRNPVQFDIPTAFFVEDNANIKSTGSYHTISNTLEKADIMMPEHLLCPMYKNYHTIIFKNISQFKQSFFDAICFGNKVYYENNNDKIDSLSEKIFGQNLNIANKDNIDHNKLKEDTLQKHTSTRRVNQLLSQLPINQELFTGVGA